MWIYHRVMRSPEDEVVAISVDPGQEQSDLGLHCLPRPVCPKTWDHYGRFITCKQIFNKQTCN